MNAFTGFVLEKSGLQLVQAGAQKLGLPLLTTTTPIANSHPQCSQNGRELKGRQTRILLGTIAATRSQREIESCKVCPQVPVWRTLLARQKHPSKL